MFRKFDLNLTSDKNLLSFYDILNIFINKNVPMISYKLFIYIRHLLNILNVVLNFNNLFYKIVITKCRRNESV